MDIISNKIAAFVIDSGTHAEWVFPEKQDAILIATTSEGSEHYSVLAESLVFSIGLQTPNGGVEIMVGITPVSDMTFALDNADCYTPALLHKIREEILFLYSMSDKSKKLLPKAESYRMLYRHIFGFDGTVTNIVGSKTTQRNRSRLANTEVYNKDQQHARLSDVVHENPSAVSTDMAAAGFQFVAIRAHTDAGPQSVFWANGHFTKNATEDHVDILNTINIIVNSHLHTRYLNSLLSPARGFCPHLLV